MDLNQAIDLVRAIRTDEAQLFAGTIVEAVRHSTRFALPGIDTLKAAVPETGVAFSAFESRAARLPFPETTFVIEMPSGCLIMCATELEDSVCANVFAVADKGEFVVATAIGVNMPTGENGLDDAGAMHLLTLGNPTQAQRDKETESLATLGMLGIATGMYLLGGEQARVVSTFTPSKVKNQMRASKGRLPLMEYKVVQVDITKPNTLAAAHRGGHHRSPRTHLRRGTWVHRGGKVHWRSATVVKGDKGMIAKEYNVVPKEV